MDGDATVVGVAAEEWREGLALSEVKLHCHGIGPLPPHYASAVTTRFSVSVRCSFNLCGYLFFLEWNAFSKCSKALYLLFVVCWL